MHIKNANFHTLCPRLQTLQLWAAEKWARLIRAHNELLMQVPQSMLRDKHCHLSKYWRTGLLDSPQFLPKRQVESQFGREGGGRQKGKGRGKGGGRKAKRGR